MLNSRLRWFFGIFVMAGVAFLSLLGWIVVGKFQASASALLNEPSVLEDGNNESIFSLAPADGPQVWAFEITPPITAEKITIGWCVHDENGDLDRVGILRAADLNGRPDPDSWIELLELRRDVSSYDAFLANYGSVDDTPSAGTSWYSLYVTDKAGNVGFARDPILVTSTRAQEGMGDIPPSFQDVSRDHWAFDDIEILYRTGFTNGCSEGELEYCPAQDLSRAEYAVFAERSYHGTDYVPEDPAAPYYIDTLLTDWFINWAEGLRLDGLTAGCALSPPAFCPLRGLPRKEGAVIALRIMNRDEYEPPMAVGVFSDARSGEWSDAWVEAAFHAGLLAPCEPGWDPKICPDKLLSRAMIAHMMVVARGLSDSLELTSVHMLDAMNGWATTDPKYTRVLRTTDGGSTWHFVTPPVVMLGRSETFFLSPTHAWVVSFQNYLDPIAWRTQDGGSSWEMSHLYPEPKTPGVSHERAWIGFTDPDHGWLALEYQFSHNPPGASNLYYTTNGGTTWKYRPNLPCLGRAFNFLDAQHGWMVCDGNHMPRLSKTSDGGETWIGIDLPLPEIEVVSGCSGGSPILFSPTSGTLLLYCWSTDGSGSAVDLLYRTQDGGQTWQSSMLPGDSSQLVAPHYDLQFLDPQTAILFGPDGFPLVEPFYRDIHRTLDGGQTWEKMGSLPWGGQLSFGDIDHGWILVESRDQHTLLFTSDGGKTLNPIGLNVVP